MVEVIVGSLALIVGIVVGFLIASLRAAQGGSDDSSLRTAAAVERARADALEARVREVADASVVREREIRADHERYVARVTADQAALKEQFKSLASDVLKSNNEQFLEVAGERIKRAQQVSDAELAKREESVKQLVEPMAKALDDVRRQTTEADKARAEGQSTLSEQVRQMVAASEKLDKKTSDFINTLRRSDVRGNWGEVQLRRVVELAGMVQHVDFEEQENVRDSEGKNLRPDMTVKLAGGRTIVVDSKVALSALLEAFETEDELVRADRLVAHARHVKKHVDDLSAKKYWDQFDSAPEFVVMFLPSEAFYQSAVEQDPALQEYAFGKNVVIATPTTLVAMLRTVAHAWREDTLAQNAQQVLATGKELYERLSVMGGHLSKVGKALDSASRSYNATVASMESRVLVSARKFGEMQAISAEIAPSIPSEEYIRPLSAPEFTEQATVRPPEHAGAVDIPSSAVQEKSAPLRLGRAEPVLPNDFA
ncbi:DNA recombination protein RmuC [Demequina oxidasica]|uniref:DNA recombination protein RmuC n=1 Tax=Demequina oxidasica TaxID=676199 RepID=UPI0007828FDF|nr:DNA recombination protein RmuC [Demequina oxidasica]